MFILSAFADEISPDPRVQLAVLKSANVRHIEFRSIHKTNVLALTDAQIREFDAMRKGEGFGISAIGSPIGKIAIDAPFEPHLDKFKRAIELCAVFGTPNIRVFSYYPPATGTFDGNWEPHREEIYRRMRLKTELATKAGIVLFHENEHKIFGDSPERVRDLFKAVNHPNLRAAHDNANWIFCGYDPIAGWELTKEFTSHLHIKDWKTGEEHGVLPGYGHGQIPYTIWDAVQRGYDGFAVMEPHLRGGGPTGGVTGADLFPIAIDAFRQILRICGGVEKY